MFPSVTILMWGKHMSTGYLGPATTPYLASMTLEQRVARLERELEKRDRRDADRRMWRSYYGFSAYMAVMLAVIVYLAASLD